MSDKQEKPKQLDKQIATLWATFGGEIDKIFNYELDYNMIHDMLQDETIMSGLEFFSSNVHNTIGTYTHPNKEIEEFITYNFENLDIAFPIVMQQIIIDTYAYGFSVSELVWTIKDNKYHLKKIVPLPPDTITFTVKNKEISGIVQTMNGKEVEIPRDKLLIVRNGLGLYGQSKLSRVYKMWRFKNVMIKFWAIANERFAIPTLHGKTRGDAAKLGGSLSNLWSNGVLVTDPDTLVETIEPKSRIYEKFYETIEYANLLIYRGLLLPQLLSTVSQTGSYSLGKIHLDLFQSTVKNMAKVIAEHLLDDVIYKIIRYNNFQTEDYYGKFLEHNMPNADDRFKLSQSIQMLVNSGIIDPDSDNDWIRDLLYLPLRKNDEILDIVEDIDKES